MFASISNVFRLFFFRLSQAFRPRSSPRIFVYFDGAKWRSIDPIQVIYALENHASFSAEKHFKAASEGNRQAIEVIASAVCDAFDVRPYSDGVGLTIAERKALLDTFYLYCEAVKKNT